ncbi:DNA fragmentation factor subunit alpha [Liparis tanakae]|uniref:DNAation factor subunit alpha n=1 Tax=Liparis tanakae TaxID=230148 RepID=A0A4Z2JC21_9TELE|nr:DNA fragmentation factor subunit alpha [Liparis tanakae]
MADRKPCKVCNFTRQKSYGLAVPSLDDLKMRVDGGTAWMARDSLVLEADTVDSSIAAAPWLNLAQQLKQDLTSIILMSDADLQTLVEAPCPELASALGFQEKRTEDLQETLQRVLDRREEERQSKELLQLYLKAAEKSDAQQEDPSPPGKEGAGNEEVDGVEVDSASGFMSRTLMVLKGKTSPETRLSTEDLQLVVTRGVDAMEHVLGWDRTRTSALLQACEAELTGRLQQVQAVQSIRSNTQLDGSRQAS